MQEIQFNQEVTVEDKYREFDVNLQVSAIVKEERAIGYPTEIIVDILDAEILDQRDVDPYSNGQSMLGNLDAHTIEFLKDQAVKEMV